MHELPRLIPSLQSQAQTLRDESERRLLQATCSGVAIIFSVLIGWMCTLHWASLFSLSAGAILSSGVLIPLSLYIAAIRWERILASWVISGDIFKRLRYLEYQYYRDLDRIKKLPLAEKEKKELYAQTHKQFLLEAEPLRAAINRLDEPGQRNLLRK